MHKLTTSPIRLLCCLLWCLSWPAIAVALLTPLPFGFVARSDLLGHFLLFGTMSVAIVSFARDRSLIIALAMLTIAYSVGLEIAQGYVPSRTVDAADAIANFLGGTAGCLGALAILWLWIGPAQRAASEG